MDRIGQDEARNAVVRDRASGEPSQGAGLGKNIAETGASVDHALLRDTRGSGMEAALALAGAGLPVFPCDERKAPRVRWKEAATTDPATVRDGWTRWPEALPAVPMGAASGLFAVDLDVDRETGEALGEASLRVLGLDPLAHPFRAATRSGGRHLFRRWRPGLPGNSVGRLSGVDIRSEGGYVIAWDPEALIAAHRAADLDGPPAALLAALAAGGPETRPTPQATAERLAFDAGGDPFFAAVKAAALADAGAWVPKLLPTATFQPGTEAWRVRSADLGRDLEEDLSIHPDGIRDFGEERGLSPLDLVMRWGEPDTPRAAADWLCEALGVDPAGLRREGGAADAPGSDWPELIPLEGGDLPRLSPDMLGGWLGEFAAALSEATETPFELAACMTLGAVSAATARRMKVQAKPGYLEPCNLWVLPALAPGNRKSAVEKAAAAPLRDWERDRAEAMRSEIASTASEAEVAKARAKELKARAAKEKTAAAARDLARQAAEIEAAAPDAPRPPQIWTSDATPENLGVLLEAQGERIAWISSEGGFFEIVGGRYSSGVPNLDLMLKAHAGDPERVDRIGRPPVHLREPLLTLAMAPQPELLRGLATKPGFRGRGLLARLLYFLPPSTLGYRTLDGAPVPEAVEGAYARGLRALLDAPAGVDAAGRPALHVVRLSPGAFAAQRAFALGVERGMRPGGRFETLTDWAGKAPGAAIRVAGVLHAADHAGAVPWAAEIPAETMERALAIIAVAAEHALAAHRLMQADPGLAAAEALWRWIERRRRPVFSAREAWQGLKGRAERGCLALSTPPGGGAGGRRPSPTVTVRPDLSEGWT